MKMWLKQNIHLFLKRRRVARIVARLACSHVSYQANQLSVRGAI